MLVSVLMSVCKEESRHIREAIDSILAQTFKDFEFIIVGDTPESERERVFGLISEYEARDRRILFVPNMDNIGLTRSLNVGLKYCKGKYVARMDADDISLPTRLEKQVQFMESHNMVLATGTWLQFIDIDGRKQEAIVKHGDRPNQLRLAILKNTVMGHPTSMFRRIINDKQIEYDESLMYAQDYSLWVSILQYGDLSNIQEVLLYYRVSNNQISVAHRDAQIECARTGQRKAFTLLYGFPFVESFMQVMSAITLQGKNDVPEEEARNAFGLFFKAVKCNSNNREALKYLSFLYADYYKNSSKKYFQLLFEATKRNSKLLLIVELEYVKRFILRRLGRPR